MPELSDEGREYLNPWLRSKLEKQNSPPAYDLLIEIDRGNAQTAQSALNQLPGVSLNMDGILVGRYIPATVPNELVDDVARLDAVKKVHYDMPVTIAQNLPGFAEIPRIRAKVSESLSGIANSAFGYDDPLLGEISINDTVVPHINFEQFGDPIQAALTASDQYAGTNFSGNKFIPTSESNEWLMDSDAFSQNRGSGIKTAAIDTGYTPTPDATGARMTKLRSFVPGEPPLDGLGHGTWVTNTIAGKSAPSTWGTCNGVAPKATIGHFKALNTFPGFGRTSWIIRAMESAVSWGADVVNMSLGGTQQGSVSEDPQAQAIKELCRETLGDDGAVFVVSAGNSGPGEWTIGSPGVAPWAVTVGAWSLTDDAPASFSSRGPSGAWYEDNQSQFQSDKKKYGSDLLAKPDVAASGGGRAHGDSTPMELLHQVCVGWMEGMYDGLKEFRGGLKGTSMSSPQFAGLVARMLEAGVVDTHRDVKGLLKAGSWSVGYDDAADSAFDSHEGKNIAAGWGPGRASRFVDVSAGSGSQQSDSSSDTDARSRR